jgi:hypothetical protein
VATPASFPSALRSGELGWRGLPTPGASVKVLRLVTLPRPVEFVER